MWTIVLLILTAALVGLASIGAIGARRERRARLRYDEWDREVAKYYSFAVWCRVNGQVELARSTYECVNRLIALRDMHEPPSRDTPLD